MDNQTDWSFASVWNGVLEQNNDRPVVPRENIWASELGKPDIDVYLKLKGEMPTNVPNARSRRKFQAGNIWEYIVKIVLMRAGILKGKQTRVAAQQEGLLEVTGKVDFEAGGAFDYVSAVNMVEELRDEELPFLYEASKAVIEHMREKYLETGMQEKILECKSVGDRAFTKIEERGKALAGHDLQLFHYCYNLKKEGVLVYVCREDCRITEIRISPNDPELLERYLAKIKSITDYYRSDTLPPLAPLFVFDEVAGKFTKNLGVEYSSFLKKLYGFEQPSDYGDMASKVCGRWNRVLGRVKKGQDMTANNKEALEEIRATGFDIDQIIKDFSASDEEGEE